MMESNDKRDRPGMALSRRTMLQGFAALSATPFMNIPGMAFAAEGPRYGGTFIVGSGSEPRHLNQNITTDAGTKLVSNPMFSKLVGLDTDFNPVADLAKSWTVSDDGLEYRFTLEEGVTWHDGQPFSADDVKFTFEKVLFEYHNLGRAISQYVESIQVPDPATIVFRLKSPNDVFLTFVASQSYIQPKHIYDGTDIMTNPANTAPIGTGPFKFGEWSRGRELVLNRNEDYFRKDRPYVDRIVSRFIPEASSRVRALEAGEIDYVAYFDLPPSTVETLRSNPNVTVVSEGHNAWGSVVELMMNLDNAPYNDRRVRQAISHAVDRQFLIDKANFGLSKVATGPISSEIAWAYNPDTKQYPYDPEIANKLLDEAGFPRDGNGVRFKAGIVVTRTIEANLKAAQIIAEQLKQVGIEATVRAMDSASSAETVYIKRNFDMFVQSLTTGPDPAMGMQRQYISTNIRPVPYTNGIGYRNPEVDDLLNRAASSPNRGERAELYKDVSALLCDDAALVWLYENAAFSAYTSTFGNLHTWAAESIYNYADVYWEEGDEARS